MEELIYRIKFEGLDAQAQAIGQLDGEISQLNATVRAQREAQKLLSQANKEGSDQYKELEQSIGQNLVASRNLAKQKSDLIRETQNEAAANQKSEGSIVSLRAQLAILTKEYNNLSKAERDAGKGKDIQNQARAISDELKNLEGAIGDTRRNVGNYAGALVTLEKDIKGLIAAQAALTKSGQANTTAYIANEKALEDLAAEYKEVSKEAEDGKNKFNSLTGAINETGNSSESLKTKLRELKQAAATAGEGTEDFKRLTAEAAVLQDQIDDANEAIAQEKGTAFERFRSTLGGIGESLGNLDFKQANQRIASLGGNLKGLNFKSLVTGVKDFGSTLLNLGKAILSNPIFAIAAILTGIGIALFSLKDKVKIIGQAFDFITAPIKALIQGAKDLSDALGLTSLAAEESAAKAAAAYAGAAKVLQQTTDAAVGEIQREINVRKAAGETVVALEREKLEAIQAGIREQIKLKNGEILNLQKGTEEYKAASASLRELRESYKDASSAIVEFDAAQITAAKDATDKAAKELDKSNKDRIKANEDLRRQIEDANIKLIQDETNRQLEQAALNNQRRKEDIAKTVADTKLKNEALLAEDRLYQQEIFKILEAADKKETDARQKKIGKLVSDTKETSAKLIEEEKKRQEALQKEQDRANREELAAAELKVINAENDAAEIEALRQKLAVERDIELQNTELTESEIALIKARFREQDEALTIQAAEQRREKISSALGQAAQALNQFQQLQDAVSAAQLADLDARVAKQLEGVEKGSKEEEAILKDQVKQENAIKKQQFDNNKTLQIAQTAIQTATNAVAAYGSLVGIPVVGPALGAVAAGIAVAVGVAQIAAIAKTQFTPTKLAKGGQIPFDTGGIITGNSHAQGGVPFMAGGQQMEAEGGELVVNKNIWSRPDFVNSISAMNAATGGVRFADGGVIPTRFTPSGQSITTAALTSQGGGDMSDALIPILSNIQVTNNVVDTSSNQSTLINITNNSTL